MSELSNFSNQLADAVERAGKSIVMVNGRERQPASGIVFGADLILTADHVLEREDNLSVRTHDGRTVAAQFAGRDPSTDLAVLKAPGLNLPAIETAQPARVGNITLAVGRPDGDGL
ncbi:MAG TPA: serine protease, partial [Thermoflexales bacterium]|nr:serine protease [Thermoflexales bacterium]